MTLILMDSRSDGFLLVLLGFSFLWILLLMDFFLLKILSLMDSFCKGFSRRLQKVTQARLMSPMTTLIFNLVVIVIIIAVIIIFKISIIIIIFFGIRINTDECFRKAILKFAFVWYWSSAFWVFSALKQTERVWCWSLYGDEDIRATSSMFWFGVSCLRKPSLKKIFFLWGEN